MKMVAFGALEGSQSNPLQYTSRSEKKDKEKTFDLNWSQGVLSAADRQAAKNPEIQAEIDTALTPNVTDPLTAIFRIGTLPGEIHARRPTGFLMERKSLNCASASSANRCWMTVSPVPTTVKPMSAAQLMCRWPAAMR